MVRFRGLLLLGVVCPWNCYSALRHHLSVRKSRIRMGLLASLGVGTLPSQPLSVTSAKRLGQESQRRPMTPGRHLHWPTVDEEKVYKK